MRSSALVVPASTRQNLMAVGVSWGHKSDDIDTRICHAGASNEPLPTVLLHRLYV